MLYLFLADGFEEIEAITVIDVLRRAEISLTTVSISKDLMVTGAHKISIKADSLFDNLDFLNLKGIILPGGMPGTVNLENHEGLKKLILQTNDRGNLVTAICAAPSILGKCGILKNKEATCYPGFEKELINSKLSTNKVVVDRNIITSRGPGTAIDFSLKIVETLKGSEAVKSLKESMIL